MLKNLLLILLIILSAEAKSQNDTSAYETQRLKINELLTERSAKFGQYEESLNARTGIFGFQTKKDIKNSNEILREIAINDNNIFRELKVLLDYKDLQVTQVQNNASTGEVRIQSYMMAIKKLQDQNQLLKEEANRSESAQNFAWCITIFLILILVGTVFFFYRKLKYT